MAANKRGFTLMELMIVVSIIALVVTIGFTNFITSIKRSRDGKRKADLEQIRSALEMCRTDTGSYPIGTKNSGDLITCGGTTYMTIPHDPLGGNYSYAGAADSYNLCTTLEIDGSYCVTNP